MAAAAAAFALLAAGLASGPRAQAEEASASDLSSDANVIDGHYIVVFDDSAEGVRAETTAREAALDFDSERRYRSAIEGFSAELSDSQARALSADPKIDFVSEDRRVTASASVPLAAGEGTPPTGVRRVQAATSTQVRQASGVNVAVIDTGIQLTHPDLNAADGIDCVSPGTPADDGNGHGTHVAGTIGAENDGAGVVGVAPGTRTYAVRVLNNGGSGSWSQVICGIDWVAANAATLDIGVANMSLGGGAPPLLTCATTTDAMHEAICNATDDGVNFAVAAGNSAQDFDYVPAPDSPAAYPEALTVTAVSDSDGAPGGSGGAPSCRSGETDDARASFSSFALTPAGRAHTIAAPGVCINSTWIGSGYRTISGTSMATPHIAGLVALCINEAGVDGPCAGLTPAEVIAEMRSDAQSYSTASPDYGFLRDPLHSPLSSYFGYLSVLPGASPPPPSSPPPSPPAAPPNDNFAAAIDLGSGASATRSGTNVAATSEPSEPQPAADPGGASVWYRWTAPASGPTELDLCGSSYDTLISVHTGSTLAGLTELASNDDYCGLSSRVAFQATAGVTYRIAVDGWNGGSGPKQGTFQLDLQAAAAPPSPPQQPAPPPVGDDDPPPAPPPPSPARDTAPPRIEIDGRNRQPLDRTIELVASCDEACTATATGALKLRGPDRPPSAADLKLEPVSPRLAAGVPQAMRLRLTDAGLKAARRAVRAGREAFARVRVTATDGSLNSSEARFEAQLGR